MASNKSFKGNNYRIEFRSGDAVKKVIKDVYGAFNDIAPFMQDAIKEASPVDTGRLRKSLRVRAIDKADPRLSVTGVYYLFYVEYGTHGRSANPFVRTELEGNKRKWGVALASAIKKRT